MPFGIIGYDQAGEALEPSPIIWGDCPNTLLNDKGLGKFVDARFDLGSPTGTIAASVVRPLVAQGFTIDCDDDTVLSRTSDGLGMIVETDADDNDAAAIYSAPLGAITDGSGKRLWAEWIVAAGDVDADMGTFFGLVEQAGSSRDVLADGVAADGVIGESLIGFLQDNGDDNAFDLVYRKDAGTVVTLLADVTNATALGTDAASLTDGAFFKLGLKFNGRDKLEAFVAGVKVHTFVIDSTFDQSKAYAAIAAIKTGTTAAEQMHLKRMRAGFQDRS